MSLLWIGRFSNGTAGQVSWPPVTAAKPWVPDGELQATALHERILLGENEARESLACLIYEPLLWRLSRRVPLADRGFIASAVTEAIMAYLEHPERFDPARADLETFLYFVAWRKVRGLIRRELRRRQWEQSAPEEVLDQMAGAWADNGGEADADETRRRWQAKRELFEEFLAGLREGDRRVMDLWMKGEKRCGEFAHVLGIGELSLKEKRTVVNRVKKRLRTKAQRWVTKRDRERRVTSSCFQIRNGSLEILEDFFVSFRDSRRISLCEAVKQTTHSCQERTLP